MKYVKSREFWTGLVITILALMVVYLYLVNRSFAHRARVENCIALNELNRELQTAWTDAGYPFLSSRFEASRNCARLP